MPRGDARHSGRDDRDSRTFFPGRATVSPAAIALATAAVVAAGVSPTASFRVRYNSYRSIQVQSEL
jgi:hypothetical protein